MSDESSGTRHALDEAIKAHAEQSIDDGEVIVSWIVLAATRRYDGGGVVLNFLSDDSIPQWEARGILATAQSYVDRQEDDDQDD